MLAAIGCLNSTAEVVVNEVMNYTLPYCTFHVMDVCSVFVGTTHSSGIKGN